MSKTFSREVREQVFNKVVATVQRKLYDPALNGVNWAAASAARKQSIIEANIPEEFESRVNGLIRELRLSHAGFFAESRPRAAAKIAIAATFHAHGDCWVFQDVHPGGPAHIAGLKPGDVLLSIAGKA